MPMIGVPEYLGCLGLSLNVIVVQGKTMNLGTFLIWSTTNFAYDCKQLTIFLDRYDIHKESRKALFSKDYWKKYEAKLLLTISKETKRIPKGFQR